MKIYRHAVQICLLAFCLAVPSGAAHGQVLAGTAKGFNLPFKEADVVRMRFEGAEATSVSTSILQITGFKLTRYRPDGTPELVIESPNCTVNISTRDAQSADRLKVSHVDGTFTLTGRGFSWLNQSRRLVVTNDLRTIVTGSLLSPGTERPNPLKPK